MINSISIQDVFILLKKNLILIICCIFLGGGMALGATLFIITPKYSSKVQLVPKQPAVDSLNASTINASLTLIDTYKDFVKGDYVLKQVKQILKKEHNESMSLADLRKSIEVTQQTNSQIFSIKVLTDDPQKSTILADLISTVFINHVESVVGGSQINIISEASVSTYADSPNKTINSFVGASLGCLVGVIIAYLSMFFGKRVRNRDFILTHSSESILGAMTLIPLKEYQESYQKSQEYVRIRNFETRSDLAPRKRGRKKNDEKKKYK